MSSSLIPLLSWLKQSKLRFSIGQLPFWSISHTEIDIGTYTSVRFRLQRQSRYCQYFTLFPRLRYILSAKYTFLTVTLVNNLFFATISLVNNNSWKEFCFNVPISIYWRFVFLLYKFFWLRLCVFIYERI